MNNVYVRSNKSILTISLTRLILILPLIFYGFYKNGFYLYSHKYVNLFDMFRPLIIIFGSALIGALINIFYEYIIKRRKEKFKNALFSSFTIEYAVLIASVMSINVRLYIYFPVLFIILLLSKFIKNRVNVMCLIFIIVYLIMDNFWGFSFGNIYEVSKNFSYTFMDYLIGRDIGGIASTHIIFLILALFGTFITNNNKTEITLASIFSVIITLFIINLIKNINIVSIIFNNNYLFIFSFIATDYVTSSYTPRGMVVYGTLIGILTAIISLLNPILAPFIAILVVSLFNILIDKYSNIKKV